MAKLKRPPPVEASQDYARVLEHVDHVFSRAYDTTSLEVIVEQARAQTIDFAHFGGHEPVLDGETIVTPVSANGVPAEWICAKGARDDSRLLWIHGGGWVSGTAASYRGLTEALSAAARASVLAIDYARAPERPYPEGLDDCETAWLWMRDTGPQGSASARSAWVAGDSAGGNLTLALMLRLRDHGLPLPAAAATTGAATDLTGSTPSFETHAHLDSIINAQGAQFMSRCYLSGGAAPTEPLVSPLHGDLHGLPPTLMHVGGWEVLLDDTLRFAEKARAAGSPVQAKVWPEMIHVFELFVQVLPEAQQAVREIGAFLQRHAG
jgi:acetyl esterase/lipase